MQAGMKNPALIIPGAIEALQILVKALAAWKDAPYFTDAERAALGVVHPEFVVAEGETTGEENIARALALALRAVQQLVA